MKNAEQFFRKGVLDIKPYVPGKPIEEVQSEFGLTEIIKMASNENPWGPSPKAVAAMEREVKNIHLYPEGPCTLLRRELSKRLGIDENMITFSNGADNCIVLVGSAFINDGDEVVMADPTFAYYQTVTKIMGGVSVPVKLKNHTHDLEAMRNAVGPKTKMVFVCNPNNPTGTIVKKGDFDSFLSHLPAHTMVVLDEAYFEFVSNGDCPNGLDYVKKGYPIVCLRTFSKIYGLAGIRIGYAFGPSELIGAMNRVREPFPVSRIAQAGALAALEDEEFKKKTVTNTLKEKEHLYKEFEEMGLPYIPSHTNFIFVDLKKDSRQIFQALLKEGVIIRPGHLWDHASFARITVGTSDENRRFIQTLKRMLRS